MPLAVFLSFQHRIYLPQTNEANNFQKDKKRQRVCRFISQFLFVLAEVSETGLRLNLPEIIN